MLAGLLTMAVDRVIVVGRYRLRLPDDDDDGSVRMTEYALLLTVGGFLLYSFNVFMILLTSASRRHQMSLFCSLHVDYRLEMHGIP